MYSKLPFCFCALNERCNLLDVEALSADVLFSLDRRLCKGSTWDVSNCQSKVSRASTDHSACSRKPKQKTSGVAPLGMHCGTRRLDIRMRAQQRPVGLRNPAEEFWIERECPVPLSPCPEQPACLLRSPSIPKLPANGDQACSGAELPAFGVISSRRRRSLPARKHNDASACVSLWCDKLLSWPLERTKQRAK